MLYTLYRYITKEVLSSFIMGLLIFTGVLLIGRILKLADMVVSKGVPITDILLMVAYLLPNFAIITIPMSLLLAVLIAFSRLSGDSEIIAIKASGISLYRLLPPILLISLTAYLLTAITAVYALPIGNSAFKNLVSRSIYGRLNLNLKEQVFNTSIPGILIYVNRNDTKSDTLRDILIQDERNPKDISTIFAESGLLDSDESSKKIHLHLANGSIHQSRLKGVYRQLDFKEYDLEIDLSKASPVLEKNELDMTLSEINNNLKTGGFPKKLMVDMGLEVHRRFALPFACFIFAIVAVPLGVQNRRSGKAAGFSSSIAVILLFYIFQSLGKTLGEKELLAPFLAIWLPNIIFLAAGIYLFVKAAREERLALFDLITKAASKLMSRKKLL
ncbi:MAG: LPS export ABC transporter permease LptF [Geobacteraceae bacterium]|nr:LPS export ABC transporter permease LptF [Geobacteraceae bacterium]